MPKVKIQQYHLDLYEDEKELLNKILWLKEYAGIRQDSELLRWVITQLERRLKDELEIIKEAKAAIKEIRKERAR